MAGTPFLDLDAVKERTAEASALRLGYPESGTDADLSKLGLVPGSLAATSMLNIGSPASDCKTYHLEVKDHERELLKLLARYYGLSTEQMAGYVTSGGTEGNFAGLWWSRLYFTHKHLAQQKILEAQLNAIFAELEALKTQSESTIILSKKVALLEARLAIQKQLALLVTPCLVFSAETHYSIGKIGAQLKLEINKIDATGSGTMELHAFEEFIKAKMKAESGRALIVVVNIGTTFKGAIDDVPAIKAILDKYGCDYTLHADAALLGAVTPAICPFGPEVKLLGDLVNTMAISGHKFFGTPSPSGFALTHQGFLKAAFPGSTTIEYAGSIEDMTFAGCRSSLSILQLYLIFQHLELGTDTSHSKIRKILDACAAERQYFYDRLKKFIPESELTMLPHSFNICFPAPSEALLIKYQLMPRGQYAAASILPHVTRERIDAFLAEFRVEYDLAQLRLRNPFAERALAPATADAGLSLQAKL